MRIALFDYEAGNMHSLSKALVAPDVELVVERDARRLVDADAVVLPGVGAFDAAASRLAPGRDALRDALRDGLPCLGICLGMQLLFEVSEESETVSGVGSRESGVAGERLPTPDSPLPTLSLPGIGFIAGSVTRLSSPRVPQIGWNSLESSSDPLLARAGLETVYYANSFVCRPASRNAVRAWSEHDGDRFAAMVRQGGTVGVQFHPEKSSAPGVRFVHAWLDELREEAR